MGPNEKMALAFFILGVLGLFGGLVQYPITAYPLTYGFLLLLLVPYLYIQFKKGMQKGMNPNPPQQE